MNATPYAASADTYFRKGWTNAIPVQGKSRPVSGFTGGINAPGKDVTFPDIQAWIQSHAGWNVGLRMKPNCIGIDVDQYVKDGVQYDGMTSLQAAEAKLGALPATYKSSSRGEGPSGILFFKVPIGTTLAKCEKRFEQEFGQHVELIHRTHRYAIVNPSVHPDTMNEYRWYDPSGQPCEIPDFSSLADLPASWLAWLNQAAPAEPGDTLDRLLGPAQVLTGAQSERSAQAAMAKQLENVRTVQPGKVEGTFGGAGRVFGRFVGSGFLTEDEALNALLIAAAGNKSHSDDWNREHGKAWTAESKFKEGIRNGIKEPREVVPDEVAKSVQSGDLFTDAALAQVVTDELLGARYLYTLGLGWMHWTNVYWEAVDAGQVRDEVRRFSLAEHVRAVDALKVAAASQDEKEQNKAMARVKGWKDAQSKGKLDALVALSSDILLTDAGAFDLNAELLNCPNGVVDLRTGAIMEHDPALLMTKVTAVAYRQGASDPAFKSALQAVSAPVERWLQVRLGQAITGGIPDDGRFVIMTGGGANGKTTLMNAIFDAITPDAHLDAGYGRQVVSELLLKSKGDGSGASPAKMTLKGTRLAYFEETPEGRHLDANVVKKLMDTPKISARNLYKNTVTFGASHSMFLNTNYVPAVAETDHGTWRRLVRVDFPVTFVHPDKVELEEGERHGDPMLKQRLLTTSAREAALAWLVEGAVAFYAKGTLKGFQDPEEIEASTSEWRMKSDQLLDFMSSRFAWGADARGRCVDRKTVYELYRVYCEEGGYAAPNMATFLARLAGHSVVKGVRESRALKDAPGMSMSSVPLAGGLVASQAMCSQPDSSGRIRVLTGLKFV